MLTVLAHVAGYGVWLALLLAGLWLPGGLLYARLAGPTGARSFPSALAIGFAAWGLALFALATVGCLRPALLVWLAGLAAAAAVVVTATRTRRDVAIRDRLPSWSDAAAPVAVVVTALGAAAALSFFFASLPSVGWDDAVYHLRLPRLYLEAGGFRPVPFSMYSHWPQGMELLYALGMALRDHVLAKLLHWSTAVLAAVVVFQTARRVTGSLAALAGSAFLVANPVFLFEARFAYVDVALALFLALAFRAVELAESPALEEDGARLRHLGMAGIFLGLMTGAKLTGWLGVAALGTTWLAIAARGARRPGNRRRLLLGALAIVAPILVLAAPWHLKAWIETGNPVYPFLFAHFGGSEWSAELAAEFATLSAAAGGRLADLPWLPLRLAAGAVPGTDGSGGALGQVWIAALPLALVGAYRQRIARRALGCGGIYFVLWGLGPQQIRYLLPAVPLFAIAAAIGVEELLRSLPVRARRGAEWLAAVALAVVLAWAVRPAANEAPGLLRQLVRHGPRLPELMVHPALRYLNDRTPAEARVLFLNTNKAFACRREVLADSIFEASQIADWLRTAITAREIEKRLAGARITHVLWEHVDWGIGYPPALLDLLADPSRAVPRYRSPDGRFTVLELRFSQPGSR